MTFWEGDKRKKQDRWGFDKSLVAQEWGLFHSHLIGAWMPFVQSLASNGAQVFDYSKFRNHGTIDSSSGDITIQNVSLNFSSDATNDRVDLGSIVNPNPINLNGLSDRFSIMWGAVREDSGSNFPRIIDKSSAGSAADGWSLWYDAGGINGYNLQDASGGRWHSIGLEHVTGVLQHWTFTTSSYPDAVTWFRDGRSIAGTKVSTPATPPTTTANMAIGNWNHATDRMWSGRIEYIYILDFEAPAALVRSIYYDPFGPFRMVDDLEDMIIPVEAVAAADSIWPILWRRRRR